MVATKKTRKKVVQRRPLPTSTVQLPPRKSSRLRRLYRWTTATPKHTVITFFIVGLALLCIGESIRAQLYLQHADHYRSLAKVREFRDLAARLHRQSANEAPFYCSISMSALESSSTKESSAKELSLLNAELHQSAEDLGPIPSYWSAAGFLPWPKQARRQSNAMHDASNDIKKLTVQDARHEYCTALYTQLQEIYFVTNLKQPEAVAALLAGQLDGFRSRLKNAQTKIQALRYPVDFEAEHIAINKQLKELEQVLSGDSNRYEVFASSVDESIVLIEDALYNIRQKSADIIETPSRIVIAAGAFDSE